MYVNIINVSELKVKKNISRQGRVIIAAKLQSISYCTLYLSYVYINEI